jgi:hypothetical protein
MLFHGLSEASPARSDEEFISKLGGALQVADESLLWLELLREECGISASLTTPLERIVRTARHFHQHDQTHGKTESGETRKLK